MQLARDVPSIGPMKIPVLHISFFNTLSLRQPTYVYSALLLSVNSDTSNGRLRSSMMRVVSLSVVFSIALMSRVADVLERTFTYRDSSRAPKHASLL